MPDLLRPDLHPLTLWLVVRRPDDTVDWLVDADPHLELVVDVVFLGLPRGVVERWISQRDGAGLPARRGHAWLEDRTYSRSLSSSQISSISCSSSKAPPNRSSWRELVARRTRARSNMTSKGSTRSVASR